jgi:hypothetical protein
MFDPALVDCRLRLSIIVIKNVVFTISTISQDFCWIKKFSTSVATFNLITFFKAILCRRCFRQNLICLLFFLRVMLGFSFLTEK